LFTFVGASRGHLCDSTAFCLVLRTAIRATCLRQSMRSDKMRVAVATTTTCWLQQLYMCTMAANSQHVSRLIEASNALRTSDELLSGRVGADAVNANDA